MKIKCPECGTVYKYSRHKCPNCGAVYFDMSCVDFFGNERVYLGINPGYHVNSPYLLLSVKPNFDEFEIVFDNTTTYDRYGNPKSIIPIERSIIANIRFTGVTPLDEAVRTVVNETESR